MPRITLILWLELPVGKRYNISPDQVAIVIDGVAHRLHKVNVHSFTMGDVDDPQLYAAHPLWEWEQTEFGQWVMEHSVDDPVYHLTTDYALMGHRVIIRATFLEKDYTWYLLKYQKS